VNDSGKGYIGAYTDPETAKALREIARRDYDGNQSMALRRAVRELAERRGVAVRPEPTAEAGKEARA
jgi:hypothetical protein